MLEFSIDTIRGMMLGIEFPVTDDLDEDIKWMMVVDLLIFRLMFVCWKDEAS